MKSWSDRHHGRLLFLAVALFSCALLCFAVLAGARAGTAEAVGASWSMETSGPTYFRPGKGGTLEARASDAGPEATGTVVVKDQLPEGLKVVEMSKLHVPDPGFTPIELYWTGPGVSPEVELNNLASRACSLRPGVVLCSLPESLLQEIEREFGGSARIQHGDTLHLIVSAMASVSAAEGPLVNEASVEGGGGSGVSSQSQSSVSKRPPFGIVSSSMQDTEAVSVSKDVTHWGFVNRPVSFTQAGGHPAALTTTISFATEGYLTATGFEPTPTGNPKDVDVVLPPGLLGNPTAVPQCPLKQALMATRATAVCPADTQVGIAATYMLGVKGFVGPIYNVTPEAGQSAEFLLSNESKVNFLLTAHVIRALNPTTGRREYGLAVISKGIPTAEVRKVETTFWGEPSSSKHDAERGLFCTQIGSKLPWNCIGGGEPSGHTEVPFLTWPADCTAGSERTLLSADSWEEPVSYDAQGEKVSGEYVHSEALLPGVTGCSLLQFDPSVEVGASTLQADEPAGLNIDLNVPQPEEPQTLATPDMSKSIITLPAGLSINPPVANGIQACEETGPEGINIEGEEVNSLNGETQLAPGHCPDSSIVGTAEAETPLLRRPVKGHVYLARPSCGNAALGQAPCTEQDVLDGNLYRLYLELGGKGALADTGVNIKVRLKTEANPSTGQLTSVAEEIAQLPFSKLVVKLNGEEAHAPIANPQACGTATTTAGFSTWAGSGPVHEPEGPNNGVFAPGPPDATSLSSFNVDLAGDGLATPCPSLPLNPGFIAGTVTPNAGKFSAFTMNIARADREQYVKGIQLHTPPGLLAMLSSVPLCGEAQADSGTCPESSKIGTTRVASGAGLHPFEIEGDVYLTGPYRGPCPSAGSCPRPAPFGLSVVTHVVAGPFNLGNVVVRARIDVDPHDSSATITTDESGAYALPQIVFGIPVRLKRVTVNIDRPGFMINPTNCKAQQITAKISGTQAAVASVSSPFAVGACKSLAFEPGFKASTNGHTTRKLGASLDTKLSYPKGALGNDANIAYVKVSLPKQLPSFIETLQKACIDTTFERDPADCPAGSVIGIARTKTPVLSSELSGPVYFVSHGGVKFPDIVIVLQGNGIRVDLVGNTFINEKTGITSTTFKAVPDVPVDSFELYLPQGANHALAANGNLCKASRIVTTKKKILVKTAHGRRVRRLVKSRRRVHGLVMPTEFVAQNGMTVHQQTKISVSGCGSGKKKSAKGRSLRSRRKASRRAGR